ncbi:hypothetical protein G7054_g12166 [Neopestalotiopsis clavispora]|nr:hypothetical protein G7054_g12166 [Neopestalotiopsis clavispora]
MTRESCQGVGSCQFVVVATQGPLDDAFFAVDIYSHTFDRIGEATEVDPSQAIDSQLPYTVDVITRGSAGLDTDATFNARISCADWQLRLFQTEQRIQQLYGSTNGLPLKVIKFNLFKVFTEENSFAQPDYLAETEFGALHEHAREADDQYWPHQTDLHQRPCSPPPLGPCECASWVPE